MKAGKVREIPGGGSVEEYKEVNRKESLDLADAFLSTKFVNPFSLLCDLFHSYIHTYDQSFVLCHFHFH